MPAACVRVRLKWNQLAIDQQLGVFDPVGVRHQGVNAAFGPVDRVEKIFLVGMQNVYRDAMRRHQSQRSDASAGWGKQPG